MSTRKIEDFELSKKSPDEMLWTSKATTTATSDSNLVTAKRSNSSPVRNNAGRRSSRNRSTSKLDDKSFENTSRIIVSFCDNNGRKVSNVVWSVPEKEQVNLKSTTDFETEEYSKRLPSFAKDVNDLPSQGSSPTVVKKPILTTHHQHNPEAATDSCHTSGSKPSYGEKGKSISSLGSNGFASVLLPDSKSNASKSRPDPKNEIVPSMPADCSSQMLASKEEEPVVLKDSDACSSDSEGRRKCTKAIETTELIDGKAKRVNLSPKSPLEQNNTLPPNFKAGQRTRETIGSNGSQAAAICTRSASSNTDITESKKSVALKPIINTEHENNDGKDVTSVKEPAVVSTSPSSAAPVTTSTAATARALTDVDVTESSLPSSAPSPLSPADATTAELSIVSGRIFRPRAAKANAYPDNDYDTGDNDLYKLSIGKERSMSSSSGSDEVTLIDVIGLSRLDSDEYGRCLEYDSMRIHHDFLFALSFPWHDPKLELEMTSPFDIEELPAILHADDRYFGENSSSTKTNSVSQFKTVDRKWESFRPCPPETASPSTSTVVPSTATTTAATTVSVSVPLLFDAMRPKPIFDSLQPFGRFETGRIRRARGIQGKVMHEPNPDVADGKVVCRTRRGSESGVIEVLTHLVLDDSNRPAGREEKKSSSDNDDVDESLQLESAKMYETISSLPWVHDNDLPNPIAKLERYVKPLRRHFGCDEATESTIETLRGRRCLRKMKLSVKVGGVSSRKCLFPQYDQTNNYVEATKKRKLMVASFPASVQTGTPASSTDDVQQADHEWGIYNACWNGFHPSLHPQQTVAVPTKQSASGKDKAVYIGRGRLIWSEFNVARGAGVGQRTLPQKAQQQQQVSNSLYKSTLSGQALEGHFTQGFKRPRQAFVGVRVAGHLMSESDSNTPGKVKNSATNEEPMHCPEILHGECNLLYPKLRERALTIFSKCRTGERGEDLKLSTSLSIQNSERYKAFDFRRPLFNRVPCSKGFFHFFCDTPGEISAGTNIDDFFALPLSPNGTHKAKICSVCQHSEQMLQDFALNEPDDSDADIRVEECIDCGLLVHRDCCHDSGTYVTGGAAPLTPINQKTNFWVCPVCWDHKPKELIEPPLKRSRRRSKFPSKYEDARLPSYLQKRSGQDKEAQGLENRTGLLQQESTSEAEEKRERKKCVRPSPSCALCSHVGGAMSKVDGDFDQAYPISDGMQISSKWVHEICRIWGSSPFQWRSKEETSVCAFCGENAQGCRLVKCAAKICHVVFHPMCAFIVSKLPEGKDDDFPCRPSFHFLDLLTKDKQDGTDETNTTEEFEEETETENGQVVPAILCGWHSKNDQCLTHKFIPPFPLSNITSSEFSLTQEGCFHGVDVPIREI